MDMSSGVMCRYCGKKWFPHSLPPHEKNCLRKLCGLVDNIFAEMKLKFAYPPEYSEWPLPPQMDLAVYNAHAFAEYQNSFQGCPKCLRKYPMIGIANHLVECSADPKQAKQQ